MRRPKDLGVELTSWKMFTIYKSSVFIFFYVGKFSMSYGSPSEEIKK